MPQIKVKLLSHQYEYATSSARLVALIAGRGAGKTWAGAYRLIYAALHQPGSYAVVAPTYTMLEDVDWVAVRDLATQCKLKIKALPGKMLMTMPAEGGQSEIRFRSADRPDRLRGLNLHGLWLDEAAQMGDDLLPVVQPTLRLGANPWLAVTTTPKGTSHWTYRLFGPQQTQAHVVRAKTSDNTLLAESVRRQLYADLTGILARQELEGEWCDPEGAEWPSECWGDWVLVPAGAMPALADMSRRVIAVDPSLGDDPRAGDYSAIVALGYARGLLWVEADLARRSPQATIADTLVMADRWRPHAIGIEAVAFQSVLVTELARQQRVPWPVFGIKADGPKALRIRRLGPAVTRRELRILDSPGGRLLYQQMRNWPVDQHDDGPDALEMALRLMTEMRA